jgi:hypothetical protein
MMKSKPATLDEMDSAIADMVNDPKRSVGSVVRVNVSESVGVIFLGVIALVLLGALLRSQSKYQALVAVQASPHATPTRAAYQPSTYQPN